MGALLMIGGRVIAQDTHEYVDLGLPSGTLWATCNVGANAPEEYGDYFAWGETQPKDVYNWSTYQYYDGSNLAKYTGSDGLTTLLPGDDAATTNWGNGWRMPTKEEWQELLDNTTNKWTTQNGVNGRLFTGSNGNSLFLPAVGFRWDDDLNYVGSYGYYWSSSLNTDGPNDAWLFDLYSDYYGMYSLYRGYGQSVRAVRSASVVDDHAYIDLGLPSGLLWATCNVGADTPEGYGDYFAWGETQPKEVYNWSTYQHCMGSYHTLTKYCTDFYYDYGYNGFTDNLTILLPEDDAATANWGNGWRMPTKEEWQELYNNTTVTWTQQNGVNGRLFTAPNGNSLFLPAAGYRLDSNLRYVGSEGCYWSSSLRTDGVISAWLFYFYSSNYYMCHYFDRSYGLSVRAVRAASPVLSYIITTTANPTEGGTVSGAGTYEMGTTCTLTATANAGYTFINWTENDEVVSTDPTYSFVVTGNRNLIANFVESSGNMLILSNESGTDGSVVTMSVDMVNVQDISGFQFDILMNEHITYVAGSAALTDRATPQHILLAQLVEGGTILRVLCYSMPGANFLGNSGAIATFDLVITGEAGVTYTVDLNNPVIQTIQGYTPDVIGVDGSVTIIPDGYYTITATANPTEGGTITGAGEYDYNSTCTLTATANEGYTFQNWTENGEVVSTEAEYTFTVTGDRTLAANFVEIGGGDDHTYVDLGLPSGLLWATCNVGANAPEEYGDYFAWGETQPKDVYNCSTYQHCMGSPNTLTKYCNDPIYGYKGYTDTLTILLPEDDAATANWGDEWRIPTEEEWQELRVNTTSTWTTQNGVNGCLFTAPNGNSLFLPAAGRRWDGGLYYVGSEGWYSSSSLDTDFSDASWYFFFDSYGCYVLSFGARTYGQSVRAVRVRSLPQVTTSKVTDITTSTATCGGEVVYDGGITVTECGVCWSTSPNPTIGGNHLSAGLGVGGFSVNITGLESTTIYYVRAYATNAAGTAYGNEVSFITLFGGDDHAYIDLGLPSGLLWATCNVGANAPEEYGDYFAWGETQPKDVYNWDTYQYYDGSNVTKYTGSDGLTILLPEDDAATANWGDGWRMPTKEEWQELLNNTTVTWTQQNGVNGRLFTAPNGNSLFLPAAGCRVGGGLDGVGSEGYYWSSSLITDYPIYAWYFYSYHYGNGMSNYYRSGGFSVRAVRSARQN